MVSSSEIYAAFVRALNTRTGRKTKELVVLLFVAASIVFFVPNRSLPPAPTVNQEYQNRSSDVMVKVEAVGLGGDLLSRYTALFKAMNDRSHDSLQVIRHYSPDQKDEFCVLYYIGSISNSSLTIREYVMGSLADFDKEFRPVEVTEFTHK